MLSNIFERLKILCSVIIAFLLPFLRQLITAEGKVLVAACSKAVAMAAADDTAQSGAEKMAAAIEIVKNELLAQGLFIATSLIRATIEAAYQRYLADMLDV